MASGRAVAGRCLKARSEEEELEESLPVLAARSPRLNPEP
jgi:hypothetical protein